MYLYLKSPHLIEKVQIGLNWLNDKLGSVASTCQDKNLMSGIHTSDNGQDKMLLWKADLADLIFWSHFYSNF